ncbi:MAG TPA: murein transglycosylase [Magnetospirillaceae bacterium]|nr:murein transglycosylase [Magnetospirillaceae bacterium]
MNLFNRTPITLLCAFMALLGAAKPALALEDALACGQETARQEKLQAIPDRLLHAISLVESGRWDDEHRATLAWPWTVMAEGEGRFLPSKEAAIAEVRKLQARGVRNIDVGCMQVNLLAHPDAFASLEEAFEPRTNVAYAGRFLTDLYAQDGNWGQAGAHYHSQTPSEAMPYKAKLLSVWDKARGHADARVQLASLEEEVSAARLPLGIVFAVDHKPISAAESVTMSAKPDGLARIEAERAAAKKSADAYRQAKLAEYRQKKGLAG